MHAVIVDCLEEYLSGCLPPSAQHRFEGHLETCARCRREVEQMQEATGLLTSLKLAEAVEPPPSFVAQVMQGVAEDPPPSFWSPFRDLAFSRRVVFASLLTMAVLGTVLVSREEAYEPAPPNPQVLMADGAGAPNSDQMLVTLANYEP